MQKQSLLSLSLWWNIFFALDMSFVNVNICPCRMFDGWQADSEK